MEKMCMMRFLRLKYKIPLKELAKAAGVSPQYMSDIELKESCRTKGTECKTIKAFEAVIQNRGEELQSLAEAFEANKENLFSTGIKEEDNNV